MGVSPVNVWRMIDASSTAVRDKDPQDDALARAERAQLRAGAGDTTRFLQAAGVVAVVVAGVVLRFWTRSDLWLDEALTVNISQLAPHDIPGALARDGAPPLYYFLLHFWMKLFGSGDVAVRALSGVFGVASLPLVWLAGRRAGGARTAWAALLLLASSPFAVRYATEARMYSLVMLLVLAGYLALARALEEPSPLRLASVAAISGLLVLTHYWALYLLAVVGALLAGAWLFTSAGRAARRCFVALAAGALLFVPWLPTFVFQLQHTGTPWVTRPLVPAIISAIASQVAGPARAAADAGVLIRPLLALVFLGLVTLGVFGRPLDRRRIELDLGARPAARALATVALGTLALAVAVALLTGTAFTSRYTSVVFPLVVLLGAVGLGALTQGKARGGALGATVVLGLVVSAGQAIENRTQAGEVAGAIERAAKPGDVIAYCPDQLGPPVSRLLPRAYQELTFPDGAPPKFVDWVDYERRIRSTRPRAFARLLDRRAGAGDAIWLVSSPQYPVVGDRCHRLRSELERSRGDGTMVLRREIKLYDAADLVVYPP